MDQARWESRRYGHVLALKNSAGRIFGFHSHNLEVAELSTELWNSMLSETESPSSVDETLENTEARRALAEWNHFRSPSVRRDPTSKKKLSALTLNVTQVCNLACTYCAAGGNGSYGDPVKRISVEKTLPQLESLMARAEAGSSFQITFLGGEPLLYPEGIRVLAEVARSYASPLNLDLQFVVVTNGTQFSQANIELLKELKAQVTVSMDGDAETNDLRRQTASGRGVSSKIISGLNELLKHRDGLTSVGLSGVFGDGHLDLERAWNFYRSFAVDWFDFTYDHHELKPEPSEAFSKALTELGRKAYALGGEAELRRIQTFNRYFELLDQQQQIENYCGAGKSFLMVDARNQVTTCPWLVGESREVVGVGTQLWESRLVKLSEPLIEKNNCGQCWARYLCGGGCMYIHRNRTGDKHSVDSHFCDRTKALIAESLELYVQARVESSQTGENPVQHARGHDESA